MGGGEETEDEGGVYRVRGQRVYRVGGKGYTEWGVTRKPNTRDEYTEQDMAREPSTRDEYTE